jgi:hypothetical protein
MTPALATPRAFFAAKSYPRAVIPNGETAFESLEHVVAVTSSLWAAFFEDLDATSDLDREVAVASSKRARATADEISTYLLGVSDTLSALRSLESADEHDVGAMNDAYDEVVALRVLIRNLRMEVKFVLNNHPVHI